MDSISYKTVSLKKKEIKKEWLVVDASDQILGRLSSKVAHLLRGKHKPSYTPHMDMGDIVVIVNADKVKLTGNKFEKKQYTKYTGYPGGQKHATPKALMQKSPTFLLRNAIKGMLPKNSLGRRLFTHVYVYAQPNHPHSAQKPKTVNL